MEGRKEVNKKGSSKACWRLECNLEKKGSWRKGTAFSTCRLRELSVDVWEPVQDCKLEKGKKT